MTAPTSPNQWVPRENRWPDPTAGAIDTLTRERDQLAALLAVVTAERDVLATPHALFFNDDGELVGARRMSFLAATVEEGALIAGVYLDPTSPPFGQAATVPVRITTLAHRTLAEKRDELLADLSWRARSYAMDNNRPAHDLILEAYNSARQFLTGEPPVDVEGCQCHVPALVGPAAF